MKSETFYKFNDAIVFAVNAHANQYDKAGFPYILHPLRVAAALEKEDEKTPDEPEKKEPAKKDEESKKSLEDVDKKLSNLLDNPDLNF